MILAKTRTNLQNVLASGNQTTLGRFRSKSKSAVSTKY